MRLLCCGGRDFTDVKAMRAAMNRVVGAETDVVIIHGAARGADSIARDIAHSAGVAVLAFPADWNRYPRSAGPIRNQRMIDEGKPTAVLAAPGGAGTADMLRRARAAGLPIHHVYEDTSCST